MIGKNIKAVREEKGWTQAELAEKIGYERSTLTKWENGSLKPFAETLTAIATVCEVPIERFYKNEGGTDV